MKSTIHSIGVCLNFFDCAFIGKNIQTGDFIKHLSYMLDYIRERL